MVNIIHAADFHLDSPFESLSPERAAQRRREQREGLLRLRDLAAEEQAQIVLLAGDLFDSDNAFHETTELLLQVFREMKAQVFIAPAIMTVTPPAAPIAPYTGRKMCIFSKAPARSALSCRS